MPIRYSKADKIATIVIDNPPLNVFNPELHRDLHDILKDFLADDSVSVGILTGAGTRAFSAGDDIKTERTSRTQAEIVRRHMSHRTAGEALEYPGWEAEVMRLGINRFKPIIGAVNGYALGQGLVFLLHLTDIRIASTTASFGLPEIAYGMAGAGGSIRLLSQIPPVAAMWLALTGLRIDAATALGHHLVNEVVEPELLQARAQEIAAKIARHPLLALRTEMEAIYRSQDMTREQAMAFSSNLFRLQRVAFDGLPINSQPDVDQDAGNRSGFAE